MKGLTLTQPWATLVAIGAKRIETRSWSTGYRGWLAIHAAKGLGKVGGRLGLQGVCAEEPFRSVLTANSHDQVHHGLWHPVTNSLLPLGMIVAVVNLHRVGRIRERFDGFITVDGLDLPLSDQEVAFGDYTPGRYGWSLTNVHRLATPIPCKGALGLWDVPAEIEAQIREAVRL